MKIYPPNEEYPYPHYKNGFRAWSSFPLTSRVALIISLIALIVSYIRG